MPSSESSGSLSLSGHGEARTVVDDIVLGTGEALANAVEHAYGAADGDVQLRAELVGGTVTITVTDHGIWRAPRQPTERGRGLPIMRSTMDHVDVTHGEDGTVVVLRRALAGSG